MTWTYSGDPSSSSRDYVRFLLGDTDTTFQLFQDEEIDAVLATQSNVYLAASILARAAAGKYARKVDVSGEGLSRSASQAYRHYLDLAEQLEEQGNTATNGRVPIAGPGVFEQPPAIYTTSDLVADDHLPKPVGSVTSPRDR